MHRQKPGRLRTRAHATGTASLTICSADTTFCIVLCAAKPTATVPMEPKVSRGWTLMPKAVRVVRPAARTMACRAAGSVAVRQTLNPIKQAGVGAGRGAARGAGRSAGADDAEMARGRQAASRRSRLPALNVVAGPPGCHAWRVRACGHVREPWAARQLLDAHMHGPTAPGPTQESIFPSGTSTRVRLTSSRLHGHSQGAVSRGAAARGSPASGS